MIPTDVRNLIMQFHEPDEYCEFEKHIGEFKDLVAGRPRTIKAMLWLGWWDDILQSEENMWGTGIQMPEVYRGLLRRYACY